MGRGECYWVGQVDEKGGVEMARGKWCWVGQVVVENDGGTAVVEVEKLEMCVEVEEVQQKVGQTEVV